MSKRIWDVIDLKEPRGQSVTMDGIPCTARHCCTSLNRLTEENESLKIRCGDGEAIIRDLKDEKMDFFLKNGKQQEEIEILSEENKQLKKDLGDCKKLITAIYDKIMDWDKSTEKFLKENGEW